MVAFLLTTNFSLRAQAPDRNKLISDLRTLSADEMMGRGTDTEGAAKARAYLISRFREMGISPAGITFEQPFSYSYNLGKATGINLYALIPGETEEIIVISAHYDHLGKTLGIIYNGADDNASGTAALLAMAAYYKKHKPKHTILLAAFDAEERHLEGAKAFFAKPPVDTKQIVANLNMDMISRSGTKELYIAGTYFSPELKAIVQKQDPMPGIRLRFGHDEPGKPENWTNSSDHGPFHQNGIPFLYFGVEDHPDYHKSSDTFDKIDQDFYFAAVSAILRISIAVDQEL